MDAKYVKISKLKKISTVDKYPDGANSSTIVTRYECLCGKGEIIEENTIGFNDHFVSLECKSCEKKYRPFIDISGYDFKFYLITDEENP